MMIQALVFSSVVYTAAVSLAANVNCTQGPNTACDADWTCCQTEYSNSNTGCCLLPNAVCCGNAPPPAVASNGVSTAIDGPPLPSWGVGYCCPESHQCVNMTSGGIGCQASNWAAAAAAAGGPPPAARPLVRGGSMASAPTPANYVCKPGASQPTTTGLPQVVILGDSVSIGYEPPTAAALASKAFVQHTPWDTRGGGSGTTDYGLACLPNLVRTSMGEQVHWDVIVFNFGLHDLDPAIPSQEQYEQQLRQIGSELKRYSSKQLYALTTPFMPDKTKNISIVQQLNARAESVMKDLGIPVVDLYSAVTDVCGKVYTSCPICRKDPCSYHYTPQGYEDISKVLAPAIEALL